VNAKDFNLVPKRTAAVIGICDTFDKVELTGLVLTFRNGSTSNPAIANVSVVEENQVVSQ
jgi:hypothetical protein